MTLAIADRLFETTVTTGSGPFTLQGAVSGFQGFAGLGSGAKTTFYIDDADAATGVVQKWMDVIGTVTVAGSVTTLSVDQVLASSNGTSAVNFGSGTKNVRGGIGAKVLPITDENLNSVRHYGAAAGTANAHAVTLPYAPLAYSDGMQIVYRVTAPNTTAGVFVNVNSLGNRALKIGGSDPGVGMLLAGALIVAFYKASSNAFEIANKVNLGTDVTGVLPAANGGAGGVLAGSSARVWSGLGVKNNATDAVNDIDIAPGWGFDGAGGLYRLVTALTKQLDAVWAQGNNAGGLFSGTKAANTTYHGWLIRNTTTGDLDVGFSSTLNATTKLPTDTPSGWSVVCRIFSMKTIAGSATWMTFIQRGNVFRIVPVTDYNASGVRAMALLNVSVPAGFNFTGIFNPYVLNAPNGRMVLAPGDASAMGQEISGENSSTIATATGCYAEEITNTSGQIYMQVITSGNPAKVVTIGWFDQRGKED